MENQPFAEKTREDRRSRFERLVFNEAPAASIFAAFDKWSARGKNENYRPRPRDCSRVNRIDNVPMPDRFAAVDIPPLPRTESGLRKRRQERTIPCPHFLPENPSFRPVKGHRCSTSVSPPRRASPVRGTGENQGGGESFFPTSDASKGGLAHDGNNR